jgi:hypothetical protein
MMRVYILLCISLICGYQLFADSYLVNPVNYTSYLKGLKAGDTLIFDKGTYTQSMRLENVNGTDAAPIVLMGQPDNLTILAGKDGVNTVSITKCSHLIIRNLKIDGQNRAIDAVKAEGTSGNFAHHITLENLNIVNHGSNQQIVGISTKCPAWDWKIRSCTIIGAGTGLYLGNSDGTAPFINGLIEYCLVVNTVGYNMQIKHQIEGLRNLSGMTLNGKTIIRYNVFSKGEGGSTGGSARPCLLVGNFPASGDGANDYYEIYGNFFWQNPNEALFQGTGNIALYSNIFINKSNPDGIRAVYIAQQNNFKPRTVDVFHNTVWTNNSSGGIRMFSADTNFRQTCAGNAAFGQLPISNFRTSYKNHTSTYDSCGIFLSMPSDDIAQLNMFPKLAMLISDTIDMTRFSKYTDYDLDFDGNYYNPVYRGAYSGGGTHTGWKLALEQRSKLGTPLDITDKYPIQNSITITPNPATDYIEIDINDVILSEAKNLRIFDLLGTEVTTPNLTPTLSEGEGVVRLDVSHLSPGVYFVRMGDVVRKFVKY